MMRLPAWLAAVWISCGALLPAAEPAAFPPLTLPETSAWGKHVQRTMRLLATSTPEHRNPVRILFYGQSITAQKWTKIVEQDLRQRFPHADLTVENRAISGFASQLLVRTAETDLYPFQPDLLIFHVYGAHDKYEDIFRRVRERTTAEILQQNDHVTLPADFHEITDAAKLPPRGEHWGAFMNHNWLPGLSRKYGTEFCDQRALWKSYLTEHKLEPKNLLADAVHPNAHGEFLMAEAVKAYLRYDPALGPSAAEQWTTTHPVVPADGKLTLNFEGNRVDVVVKAGQAPPAAVRIDGRKPSEFPELYALTRTTPHPHSNWPTIVLVGATAPRVIEDWTLTLRKIEPEMKDFEFDLVGSKTGPDGSGRRTEKFVSKSRRVTIDPADWNVDFSYRVHKTMLPEGFEVKWKVVPRFVDEFVAPPLRGPGLETTVTLASGLPNGKHTLEILGTDLPISAVRTYRPPLVARP